MKFVVFIGDNNASRPYDRHLVARKAELTAAKYAVKRQGEWDGYSSDCEECEGVTIFVEPLGKRDPFSADAPSKKAKKFKLVDIIDSIKW